MATPYARARPRSEDAMRVEALLGRYSNLSEQELAELINLFPKVDMVARALIAADDRLGDKVVNLYRDHGEQLDATIGGRTLPFALAVFVAAVLVWAVVN
jgi:hypothetical protein